MSDKQPQIIIPDQAGWHNSQPDLRKKHAHRDLSTIMIVPCYSSGINPRVVQAWMGMMSPMNQKFVRIFVTDMEVGAAYSQTIEQILANPELSKFKFILTVEHDNIPAPDGLLKLYDGIDQGYDAVGGLYFTKGELGKPMAYGNTQDPSGTFSPFLPPAESIVPCRGLGMGFTLFRMDMFRNPAIPKPWFKTVQEYTPGVGVRGFTQDLWFFQNAGMCGYKFACDTRVRVGHMDLSTNFVW
jgi:hypothetical protein